MTAEESDAFGEALDQQAAPLSLRDEQKRFTYERLVDAAIQVFEEVGFRAASIEQIAKRAGANRSTFYLHFKTKADLGRAMARRLIPESAALYRRLNALKSPTREDLRQWLASYVKFWFEYRIQNEVLMEGVLVDKELALEDEAFAFRATSRLLPDYLAAYVPEHRENARVRLALFMQFLSSRMHRVALLEQSALPEATFEALVDMMWDTVYGPSRIAS